MLIRKIFTGQGQLERINLLKTCQISGKGFLVAISSYWRQLNPLRLTKVCIVEKILLVRGLSLK